MVAKALLFVAGSLALLAAAFSLWRLTTPREVRLVPARTALALKAERAGDDYRVTWDSSSPLVAGAHAGTLSIEDGVYLRDLNLDRDQLRTASLLYSPATQDVTFRLIVFGNRPSPAVESVRLRGEAPRTPAAAPAPVLISTSDTTPAAPVPVQPQPRRLIAFRLPETAPRSAALIEAPRVDLPGHVPVAAPPVSGVASSLPAPPPAPQSAAPALIYTPARPLRQVPPSLSEAARSQIRLMTASEVEIRIEVRLDASGKVIGALPLTQGAIALLTGPALAAAKTWKFSPALRGGKPEPATAVISFRFAKPRS